MNLWALVCWWGYDWVATLVKRMTQMMARLHSFTDILFCNVKFVACLLRWLLWFTFDLNMIIHNKRLRSLHWTKWIIRSWKLTGIERDLL